MLSHSLDQPIPYARFEFTAYFVDSVMFSPVVIWSAETAEPYGGFTLPRKAFTMTSQTFADIAYIDLTCTLQDCTFVYTSESFIRAAVLLPPLFNLNISLHPIEPLSYDQPLRSPIIRDIGIAWMARDLDIARWFIASHPHASAGDIRGVSLTPQLSIMIEDGACYNDNAYIIAQNLEEVQTSLSIFLKVAATPRITQPVNPIVYSMTSTRFTYPLEYNAAAGQLEWRITLATSPVPDWVLISREGVIIVERGGAVNDLITVVATNCIGVSSVPVTTKLNVSQTPKIIPIEGGVLTHVATRFPTAFIFTLPLVSFMVNVPADGTIVPNASGDITVPSEVLVNITGQSLHFEGTLWVSGLLNLIGDNVIIAKNIVIYDDTVSGKRPTEMTIAQTPFDKLFVTTWSISTIPSDYSITIVPSTGYIRVDNNQYIPSQNITVTVTNPAGGSDSSTFTLRCAQKPIIDVAGTTIRTTVDGLIFTRQLTQVAIGTGPLIWTLAYTQGVLSNAFISITTDGILTVSLENGFVINEVSITVTNPFGGSATAIYSLELYQLPVIAPPNLVYSIPPSEILEPFYPYTYDMHNFAASNSWIVTWSSVTSSYLEYYTYDMQNLSALHSGPIRWSLVTSPLSQLYIDATTGVITATAPIYENVTVFAQGPLGAPVTLTFLADIERTPVFIKTNFTNFNRGLGLIPFPYSEYVLNTTMETDTPSVIDMPTLLQVTMDGIHALTWSITVPANINASVYMEPSTGLLTVNNDQTFVGMVTVTASTEAGGSDSITFQWRVAQAVNLINPGRLVATTNLSNYSYVLFQNARHIGPITWLTTSVDGLSIPDASEGTLQVIKNHYINQDVTVYTSSSITGDTRGTTFTLCIAQQPMLANPGPVTGVMIGNQNFQYPLVIRTQGTGPLTWHITTFPGLSIAADPSPDPSDVSIGIITYEHHNAIDSNVTVTAFTVTGAKTSQTFHMNVAQATELLVNGTISYSMNYKSPFVFSFADKVAGGGDSSSWTLVPDGPNSVEDGIVTINPISGFITVQYNHRVYQRYTVTLTQYTTIDGVVNAVPQSKSFLLNVAQMPVFVFEEFTYVTLDSASTGGDYILDLSGYLQEPKGPTVTGAISWSVSRADNNRGIYVSPTGILTILKDSPYSEGPILLKVTNAAGGYIQPTLHFTIAQTPKFRTPNLGIKQIVTNDDEYISSSIPIQQSSLLTGSLSWKITSDISPNVTIDSLGRIHIAAGTYIEKPGLPKGLVTIEATNNAGGSASITIPIVIVRSVVLVAPAKNTLYIHSSSPTPLAYTVSQTRKGVGTLSWGIAPTDVTVSVPGLSIIPDKGTITLPAETNIYTGVTVSTRNMYIATTQTSVNFDILKVSVPVFSAIADQITSTTSSAFSLAIREKTGLTGVLLWQITDKPGLSITSYAGIGADYSQASVTFATNNWISQNVTVSATNAIGETGEVTFLMKVAPIPIFTENTIIKSTTATLTNYKYQVPVSQTYDQVGPLQWTLRSTPYNANLSIDPTLGVITLLYGSQFTGDVFVTAVSVGGGAATVKLYMDIYFAFVFPSIPNVVINKEVSSVDAVYTGISVAAEQQKASTGPLTWSIETSIDADVQKLSIDRSSGLIRYAANNLMMNASILVAVYNAQSNLITHPFTMTVASKPHILNPGSLYLTGTAVRDFEYTFSNIADYTGDVVWETSVLDGLSINSNTGVMVYDNSNIVDQNIQYLTNSDAHVSSTSNISTATLAATFNPIDTNTILSAPYLNVAEGCSWMYTNNAQQTPQVVMNQAHGTSVFSFPTNSIWSRTFQVTATNAALGYDQVDVLLNLDGIRVPVPLETILNLRSDATLNNQYSITSSDLNRGKKLPRDFLPIISGGTTLTFTWATPPDADVYFVWTPSTFMSATLEPVYYHRSVPPIPITVPGFSVKTTYVFKFTCMPTTTTIADVRTMTFTPDYKTLKVAANVPTGATSVTLSWTIKDLLTSVTVAAPASITWFPNTFTNQPVSLFEGITSTTISGFVPNTPYVFTVAVDKDSLGLYGSQALTLPTYTTRYLTPTITLPPLQTINTGTNRIVTLYIDFIYPTPVVSTVIVLTPEDRLFPIITVLVPPSQVYNTDVGYRTYVTLGIKPTERLELGQPYSVDYRFSADASGVYGPLTLHLPSYTSPSHLILQNDLVITTQRPTGGTKITFNWTVSSPTACTITWRDPSGYTGISPTIDAGITQCTIADTYTDFVIGTPYTFSLTFGATAAYSSATVTLDPYIPVYLPAMVLISTPAYIDSSSASLSWSYVTPAAAGHITYNNSQIQTFQATDTSVIISDLVVGHPYEFRFRFAADESGVYGMYPPGNNDDYKVYYTHKTHIIAPTITITGGTTLKFVWMLNAVAGDGTLQQVDGAGATISWSPSTPYLNSHNTIVYTSGSTISGFTLDNATKYRFTFTFQETAFTLPTTYVYSQNILPAFYLAGIKSMTPQGYASTYSSTKVSMVFSWEYGYTDNNDIFVPVNTDVDITWDVPTVTRQPFKQTSKDTNIATIPNFLVGETYRFTFSFKPDPTGMTPAYTYVYPQALTLSYPLVDNVTVSNADGDITTLLVSWEVSPATPVTVVAVSTNASFYPPSVAAGVQSLTLYGVAIDVSYQITVTFAATDTTLEFKEILEYANTL